MRRGRPVPGPGLDPAVNATVDATSGLLEQPPRRIHRRSHAYGAGRAARPRRSPGHRSAGRKARAHGPRTRPAPLPRGRRPQNTPGRHRVLSAPLGVTLIATAGGRSGPALTGDGTSTSGRSFTDAGGRTTDHDWDTTHGGGRR